MQSIALQRLVRVLMAVSLLSGISLHGCMSGVPSRGTEKTEYYYSKSEKLEYVSYSDWVGVKLRPTVPSDSATVARLVKDLGLRVVSLEEIANRWTGNAAPQQSPWRTLAEDRFWVLAKRSGERFDRFNSSELKGLRLDNRFEEAGPIVWVGRNGIRFLTNRAIVRVRPGVRQSDLISPEDERLVELIRPDGRTGYRIAFDRSIGEGLWEIIERMTQQEGIEVIDQILVGAILEYD